MQFHLKLIKNDRQRWIIHFWYGKNFFCQFGLESIIWNVFNIPIWFLEVSGSIWVIYSSFCRPYPKKADFGENWKFKFFQIFTFKMALMGSHDKNYKFFMIFGPLAWLVRLREAFNRLCYDFQGGGYLGGIDKLNFWFLAKIHKII